MTPRTFKTTDGNEWTIKIGLFTARRIRELSNGAIDFVETSRVAKAKNALVAMSEDVQLCGQVLWWLCESQATELGLTEEQFADGFDIDALDAAQTAVAEAVIDFFPKRARPALRKAAEIAAKEYGAQMETLDQAALDLVNSPDFEAMIRNAIRGNLSSSSQGLQDVDPVISSVSRPN